MQIDPPRLALGFVIYKPDNSFYERIELINTLGVPFYIYDNSPEITQTSEKVKTLLNAYYLTSGINAGLGVGLAEIGQRAYQDDFDGLLFFDQDTGFNVKTISFIQSLMNENISCLLEKYSAIAFSGPQTNTKIKRNDMPWVDIDFAINSGSLFILKNLEKLGWHNKTYFVDNVDYEFCLRSHFSGLKIGKFFNTPYFDHESEQPDQVVVLFRKRLLIRKYSYIRIKDAIFSYFKMIVYSLTNREWRYAIKIIRSLLIYVFGQILARRP